MPIFISIFNKKGGVGKTTTSVSLAIALGASGARTCLIDADTQGNATLMTVGPEIENQKIEGFCTALTRADLGFEEVAIKTRHTNLTLIPNEKYDKNGSTLNPEGALSQLGPNGYLRMSEKLQSSFFDNFNFVIIDTPPTSGVLTSSCFIASDYGLIVSQLSELSNAGIVDCIKLIKDINKLGGKTKILGILPTMVNATHTKKNKKTFEDLKKRIRNEDIHIFKNYIPVSSEFASLGGKSIFEISDEAKSKNKAALAYWALTTEISVQLGLIPEESDYGVENGTI